MTDFTWYRELIQPAFNPPSWVFTPVWLILYIMIISAVIFYAVKPSGLNKTQGYILFAVQMILNWLWAPAFFLLRNIGLALVIVILMDIAVFFNIKEFMRICKISGYLLVPYFLWILFATYLTAGFYFLNK